MRLNLPVVTAGLQATLPPARTEFKTVKLGVQVHKAGLGLGPGSYQ